MSNNINQSQWVSDVKSFTPTPAPIVPYIIFTVVLILLCCVFGLYKFRPPSDGIEETNTQTGEKTKNKWIGWVFFLIAVFIFPTVIGSSLYKLHFMVNNPKLTATSTAADMFSKSIGFKR